MESQFWIRAWNEGRTNFHQENYHDKLTAYFPQLDPQLGQKVPIELMESNKPNNEGARLSSVENLRQTVYILEKTY